MEVQEKVQKLIDISKKTVILLKRKMNKTQTIKEHEKLKKAVYDNINNVFILSEVINNIPELKREYSSEELKNFFDNIKRQIKNSQDML